MSEHPKEPNFDPPPGFFEKLEGAIGSGETAERILKESVLKEIEQAEQRQPKNRGTPIVRQDHGIPPPPEEIVDSLTLVARQLEEEGERHAGQRGDPD